MVKLKATRTTATTPKPLDYFFTFSRSNSGRAVTRYSGVVAGTLRDVRLRLWTLVPEKETRPACLLDGEEESGREHQYGDCTEDDSEEVPIAHIISSVCAVKGASVGRQRS